jgi:hypothetical protein
MIPLPKPPTTESVFYDPADLTTHAVVTGMTGSGKTGLCITCSRKPRWQASLPSSSIPRGTSQTWCCISPTLRRRTSSHGSIPEMARRAGKTLDQLAVDASGPGGRGCRSGASPLNSIGAEERRPVCRVYTWLRFGHPCQRVVVSHCAGPGLEDNRESLREKIASTVTALLGLVGYEDIDPIRSREHILLANIFESSWSQGKDVELTELILQTPDAAVR